MKLIINITLVFLLISNSFGQGKNHVITYGVTSKTKNFSKKLKTKKEKQFKNQLNNFFNSNKVVDFKLICSNTEAVFFMVDKIKKGNAKKSLVEIILGKNYFYSNLNKQIVLNRKETLGEFFIIKHKLFNWTITNEEKKIGKYYCKKATGIKKVINDKGVFNHKVEAWFTTEMPINFAPDNYRGLPGLIIELNDNKFNYKVKKIELNKEVYKIKKPTKGKKITYEELNEIYKEMAHNMRS